MLLKDLFKIVKKGAEEPLSYWIEELNSKKSRLTQELLAITDSLEGDTLTKKQLLELANTLNQVDINELELAKNLLFVPNLFKEHSLDQYQELLNQYIQAAEIFHQNATLNNSMAQARATVKNTLDQTAQKIHDRELFEQGGMFYCLEYYLMLYKKIIDSPNDEEKRKYFEAMEINVGVANLPGLWIDFYNNEVLEKFIYNILGDGARQNLEKSYFSTKKAILNIKRDCHGANCVYDYSMTSLNQAIEAVRQLIIVMIKSFKNMGLNQLGSQFLTPYGEKPKLDDLLQII